MTFKCTVTYYISAETEEEVRKQLPLYLKNVMGDIEVKDATYTDSKASDLKEN